MRYYMDVDAILYSIGLSRERRFFGPDLVEEAESIVHHIQENLKAAKSRQETYANKRR
jgi:hypothetical protein